MAPRIVTALLGTVMASGLMLSPLAAQALPLDEGSITATENPSQITGANDVDSAAAVGNTESAQDSVQQSGDALSAGQDVPADAPGVTEDDPGTAEVIPAAAPSEGVDPSIAGTQGPIQDGSDNLDLPTVKEKTAVAEEPGLEDAVPSNPSVEVSDQVVKVASLARTTEPENAEGASTTEAVEESVSPPMAEVPAEEPEMPAWMPTLTMPEGSEAWDENQWNEFLDSDKGQEFIDEYNNAMMDSPELQTIIDIVTDFETTGDEYYLDELWEYLNELFPDNPEWAQEAFDGILAGLGEREVTEPDSPEASTPTLKPEKRDIEIKPAATVTKPVVQKKHIAQAVAKPLVETQRHELANTGSNGTVVMGGLGLALLLGGTLTLVMRKRQKGL
ncbi:LPXTG cell wall anchor domain-containing protein [Paeniglutamicibacter sp. ORCA_105]|uniref:LPXTG cell wall anchor domain-containing protein n=1 Tax=Paeniglutamicibacter sp. ORCA_105 TaxID=3377336 RepID=UPI003893CE48